MATTTDIDVAVIGAGPYGVSLAAAACAAGHRAVVFGLPFETWNRMDPEMQLRAASDEMSLCAGDGAGSLGEWPDSPNEDPMRVTTFVAYGRWFVQRFVRDLEPMDVVSVSEAPGGRLAVDTPGRSVTARTLILAVGITPFPYAPPRLERLLGDERVSFATEPPRNGGAHPGERVAVVGAGQSAVEAAVKAAAAGAETTLLARRRVAWFADREPFTPRGAVGSRFYDLLYPAVGYGPPPLNRLVLAPDLFALLPRALARPIASRMLRPGASPWLRRAVEDGVRVREDAEVRSVATNGAVQVELADGERLEVDSLVLGTGYRFDLGRLGFLDERVRDGIHVRDGWPVLDRCFRSTDPRIRFVGYAAEGRFGPVSRFVLGVPFATRRIVGSLA